MCESAAGFRWNVVSAEVAPSGVSCISGEDGQGCGTRFSVIFHISEDTLQSRRAYRFGNAFSDGNGQRIEISGRFDSSAEFQSDFAFQILDMSFPVLGHLSFSDSDVAMKQGTNLHFFFQ